MLSRQLRSLPCLSTPYRPRKHENTAHQGPHAFAARPLWVTGFLVEKAAKAWHTAPKGQVSTSWLCLDESPFHPCQPIHSWQGSTSPRVGLRHFRFLKCLLKNKIHHFSISRSAF